MLWAKQLQWTDLWCGLRKSCVSTAEGVVKQQWDEAGAGNSKNLQVLYPCQSFPTVRHWPLSRNISSTFFQQVLQFYYLTIATVTATFPRICMMPQIISDYLSISLWMFCQYSANSPSKIFFSFPLIYRIITLFRMEKTLSPTCNFAFQTRKLMYGRNRSSVATKQEGIKETPDSHHQP